MAPRRTPAAPSTRGGDSTGLTDVSTPDTPVTGTAVVYANTDTTLWSMDPATKTVTKIGDFGGLAAGENATDVAVDGDGKVYVNSETAVYTATLPTSGTGTVALTLKTTLPSSSRFFALGFVPKGVLGSGESLITGDGAGDLYFIDTAGATATPQKLGSFGVWKSGDPDPGGKAVAGDAWTLSGDLVFYIDVDGTTPRGLATVRTCHTKSGTTTCQADDDVLIEVDMSALKANFDAKTSSTSLRKRFLGTGSGTGRLYGLGAWEDKVYAFSRSYKGSSTAASLPPQLVQMDVTGSGTVLKSFGTGATPDFANGWSGAGVTTKAKISVIR